jgi:hypothetical protein
MIFDLFALASLTLVEGNDFWGADTNTAHRPAAPASPSSALRWRDLFSSLRVSTRPLNTPQSIPLEPRRWNFNLFPGGSSTRTVEVAAGRKKKVSGSQSLLMISFEIIYAQRIFIAPPTAAEVARAEAAADMQRANGNEAGSSTQPSQVVSGTDVPQGRLTETRDSSCGTGDVAYEVRCCGLFFSCGRPTSHQP